MSEHPHFAYILLIRMVTAMIVVFFCDNNVKKISANALRLHFHAGYPEQTNTTQNNKRY